jgi:hypothetical protein
MTIPSPISSFNYSAPSFADTNIQEFTISGTWRKPTGCSVVMVELWGGGGAGGGGGSANTTQSGGGGGGAYSFRMINAKDLPTQVPVVIGAGGTGSAGTTGGSGGTTYFGNAYAITSTSFNAIGAYAQAGGGAGGLAVTSGGFGGGSMSNSTGTGNGSTASGTPGEPYIYAQNNQGGGHFGGSSGLSALVRHSMWGGATGDYGGSSIGGGVSGMGGCGGGSGGGYNATLPLGGTDGGGPLRTTLAGGALAMNAVGTAGKNGGPREGGGGGASGLVAVPNMTVQQILINSGTAFMAGAQDYQSYAVTSITSNTPTRGNGHNGITKIIWDGSKYVGVSPYRLPVATGSIYTSTDGINWNLFSAISNLVINKILVAANILDIGYANGTYVATFVDQNNAGLGIGYSYDLKNWVSSRTTQSDRNISVANNVFYNGGSGTPFVRSTDGITWTTPTGATVTSPIFVAGNGGTGVVVQTTTTATYFSTDNGASFSISTNTAVGAVIVTGGSQGGLTYSSTYSKFYLVGSSSIYSSSDGGNNWTLETDGTTDNYSGIAAGVIGGTDCLIVGSVSTNANMYLYSTNGTSWTMLSNTFSQANASVGGRGGFPSGGGGGGGSRGNTNTAGGAGGNGFARISCW